MIAVIGHLAEMLEGGVDVDKDLAADVAPAPAEGVILGQIPPGIGIDLQSKNSQRRCT